MSSALLNPQAAAIFYALFCFLKQAPGCLTPKLPNTKSSGSNRTAKNQISPALREIPRMREQEYADRILTDAQRRSYCRFNGEPTPFSTDAFSEPHRRWVKFRLPVPAIGAAEKRFRRSQKDQDTLPDNA